MQKQTEQNTDTTLPPARSAPDPELVAQYGREVKEELKTYPAEGREPTKRIWQLSEWEGIGYYLDNPPPEPKLLFRGKGWEIPDKCVTSLFAAGATGKTFLGFQLAACLAAGVNLGPFETSQIMRPAKKKRVLYLCGEDPQDIIHARIAAIVKHMPGLADRKADLRQNLGIHALVGFDRILIAYDQKGNPTTTEAYDALCYSIEKIGGVDVLALDPMNKFYGLKENDNAHAAAWIAMLETISVRFDAGVLFVHHESKAQNLDGDIRASSGRGAGAFRDSVRGVLSMARMTEKQAKQYDYPKDWNKMVAVFPSKANFTEEAADAAWFVRGPGGVLLPGDVNSGTRERNEEAAAELYTLLKDAVTGQLLDKRGNPIPCTSDSLTLRGLTKGTGSPAEMAIRAAMKEAGVSNMTKELNSLILRLEAENKIIIDRAEGGRGQNKHRVNVIGYTPLQESPEPESGDQDKENQPDIPDLAEGGADEKPSNSRQQDNPIKKRPKTRDRSQKHEKKSPDRKRK